MEQVKVFKQSQVEIINSRIQCTRKEQTARVKLAGRVIVPDTCILAKRASHTCTDYIHA